MFVCRAVRTQQLDLNREDFNWIFNFEFLLNSVDKIHISRLEKTVDTLRETYYTDNDIS